MAVQPLMMLAGMALLCWVILRSRMKRRRRSEPAVTSQNLQHNSNARRQYDQFTGTHSLGAPTEVLQWQVELHDLSRQLQAELDTKMRAVQVLIRQYDQASRQLAELIKKAERLNAEDACSSSFDRVLMLAAQGWPDDKIASCLRLSVEDVRTIRRTRLVRSDV